MSRPRRRHLLAAATAVLLVCGSGCGNAHGQPAHDGYGLGVFNVAGWIGHNGSLPRYQTLAVYLPEQKRTLVVLINTDIEHNGSQPSAMLATAITSVISPDHAYARNAEDQGPDVAAASTPAKPR